MKRFLSSLGLVLALLLWAGAASAQTVVPSPVPPTTQLTWDASPSTDEVTGYRLYERNTDATYTLLAEVNAATTVVNFPALTPGTHTLVVRAFNVAGESLDSNSLVVRLVVVPQAPLNFRIQ